MTQTGGKKKVRRVVKRKAPARRKTTKRIAKRKAPVRKRTTRKTAKSSHKAPARSHSVRRKRRVQHGGKPLKLPGSNHLNLRAANVDENSIDNSSVFLAQNLANTKTNPDSKKFIRSPLMDMPPHVQMDPMNDISAYLSDYYMNVDVEKLARQMYGAAVHNIYNTSPVPSQYKF